MPKRADCTGEVYGRLTVVQDDESRSKPGKRFVIVRCSCGREKSANLSSLRSGSIVSCGCKKSEHGLKHGYRRVGHSDRTYNSWSTMWQRCTNPKAPSYHRYGGRGIEVDPTWTDFAQFVLDMGERPKGDFELDRVDNDGPYCKGNCKWVPRSDQMLNTSRTLKVHWGGELVPLAVLADRYGIPRPLARQRLKNGWKLTDILQSKEPSSDSDPQ